MRKKLISLFADRFTVDIPGPDDLHIKGSLNDRAQWALGCNCFEAALTDTYGVETAEGEDDILVLAAVLAIDLTEDAESRKDRD